jgi:hypothetical protein
MKLENQDLIDQLETEKMMLKHSVKHLMRFVMTLQVDGCIPRCHKVEGDAAYETATLALEWIRQWEQAA